MPLSFPSNPTLNQLYQSGSSATYSWNGSFWQISAPAQTGLSVLTASYSERVAWVQETPPPTSTGSLWYDVDTGNTYVRYDSAWVPVQSNTVNATSASFATSARSASFAQTRPRPQYISARKNAVQTSAALNTDVTFQAVNASNELSITGSTTVGLTAGKVYLINASFGADTWANTASGFFNIYLVDSANNPIALNYAVMVPSSLTAGASTNNSLTLICAPTSSIAVKFRCVSTNTTVSLREDMCHFTITEII